jgi:16S rRNA (uracil1498-N3)-methyltransferase
MPAHDFRSPRLYVDHPLGRGVRVMLDPSQAHYLVDVLRRRPGDELMVFNGRDGEWRAAFEPAGKRGAILTLQDQTRVQDRAPDLHYLFAPLKRSRLDYMVQKAVEMGAARLKPVITRYTQVERVNTDRMRANAIEAAEQCSILTIPVIDEPVTLDRALAALEAERALVFCDEDAPIADPLAALALLRERESIPLAVLIGPEGGFAPEERAVLLRRPNIVRLALGPRILRADTAAVAALALVQATFGDWAGG